MNDSEAPLSEDERTMDDGSQNVYVRRLKIVLLASSLVSLVLLLMAAFEENFASRWHEYQETYRAALIENAPNEQARLAAARMPIEMRQTFLPKLSRIDRCITCHAGIEHPNQKDAAQPLRTHSGSVLEHHPVEKFGCTICHDGQGRAIDKASAHGEIEHWPSPLLAGEDVYTTCGRCHYENDLYGAEYDLYAGGDAPLPLLLKDELEVAVPGSDREDDRAIERGKELVLSSGCLGCHKYRGRGGTLGPDITYVGEKTKHDYDFTNLPHGHSAEDWLFAHFKKPAEVVPGTLMPDMGLTDDEAEDLTQYMLSLRRKEAPAEYTPVPPRHASEPAGGSRLYSMFCSSCHGEFGQGSSVLDPDLMMLAEAPEELMTPALNNPDTLAVASDDYFRSIIRAGRRNTNMIAWTTDHGGLRHTEIDHLVDHIRSWEGEGPSVREITSSNGNPRIGRALYRSRCASCHGLNGEGGVGLALNSPSFLAIASDDFLAGSIVNGRPNTAMPSWKQLTTQEVNDLLAFMRTWEAAPADREETLSRLAAMDEPSRESLRIGASVYRANCASCHGYNGEGGIGVSLNTDAFLSVVDDEYLYNAIVHGRPGTAMPSWKHLSEEDLVDLINSIREWNGRNRRELEVWRASGDWDRGEFLFKGMCASCHGSQAEGATGPQLSNPVFLQSVTDTMLRDWITNGKPQTEMRAFGKGGQGVAELNDAQIEDIVTYLRRLEIEQPERIARPGMGIVATGADIYASACAPCHGSRGEGGTGSSLANPEFLKAASDGYLQATIVLGRDGTAMLPMGRAAGGNVELTPEDVANVTAYIRSWEHSPPFDGVPLRYLTGADTITGEDLYIGNCAGCHGVNGNDGWAPSLNNLDFLAAATDGFLQATIAMGRANTPMRPFGIGAGGISELTPEEITNIVAYIRDWQPWSAAYPMDEESAAANTLNEATSESTAHNRSSEVGSTNDNTDE